MPRKLAGAPRVPKISVEGVSLLGGRSRQEDRCRYHITPTWGWAVLADGMGGHSAGDKAAEAAIASIPVHFCRWAEGGEGQEKDCLGPCPDFFAPELKGFPAPAPGLPYSAGTTIVGVAYQLVGNSLQLRMCYAGDSYGMVLKGRDILLSTPVQGVGNILFNFWDGAQKYWVQATPLLTVTKNVTIILASDGLDPIMGDVPDYLRGLGYNFLRGPPLTEINAKGQDFLRQVQYKPIDQLAQAAVAAGGERPDNTTLMRISVEWP